MEREVTMQFERNIGTIIISVFATVSSFNCDTDDGAGSGDSSILDKAVGDDESVDGVDVEPPASSLAVAQEPETGREWGGLDLSHPSPPPLAGATLSPKSGYQTFVWKRGMPEVKMGATGDKICVLSGVSGSFGGAADRARVAMVDGTWLLGGSGNVTSASAVCFSTTFMKPSGTYYVSTSSSHQTQVGSTANRACFFTYLQGKLGGDVSGPGLTGAQVYKTIDGKSWTLKVDGYVAQANIRCIVPVVGTLKLSDEVSWLAGQPTPIQLQSNLDMPCLLTKLTGNFSSDGDWVGLWLQEVGGVLRQTLGGTAESSKVSVATRCVGA